MFFTSNILLYVLNPVFLRLASSVLAAVFLLSAVRKIRDLRYFTGAVASYRLLPRSWVRPFANTLTLLEITIGLMLLLGWGTRVVATISAALFLVFLFAIAINLARDRNDLECGCFGAHHHEKIGWKLIGRDVVLLLLSLLLVWQGGGAYAFDNLPAPLQQSIFEKIIVGIGLNLALAGIGLYLVYRLVQQLGRLIRLVALELET